MCFSSRACLIMLVLLAGGRAFAAEPPSQPPVEAFAALPAMYLPRITPDGRKLAWVRGDGDQPRIAVYDLATREPPRMLDVGAVTILGLDWADDEILLVTVSVPRMPRRFHASMYDWDRIDYTRTLAVDTATGTVRSLLLGDPEESSITGSELVRVHTGRPGTVLMSSSTFDPSYRSRDPVSRGTRFVLDSRVSVGSWVHALFEIDIRTGAITRVESGSPNVVAWLADAGGHPVARSEWDPVGGSFAILAKTEGEWREVYASHGDQEFELQTLSADGKTILATGARGSGRSKLWGIPVGGGPIAVAFEDPQRHVVATVNDRFSTVPLGLRLGTIEPAIHWIETGMQDLHAAARRAFPSHRVEILDYSRDRGQVLLGAVHAASQTTYYLLDAKKRTVDIVGESYPLLADAVLGTRELIEYTTRDSVEVSAFLTLPPGTTREKLPLVVMAHDDSYSQDDAGFDWVAQFLATRGYAVFQPQLRAFAVAAAGRAPDAPRGDLKPAWGRVGLNGMTDGVRHLVKSGIVDPQRICIVGGGVGGYSALAAVAYEPDLYACAVSYNGIANIPDFLRYISRFHGDDSYMLDYWQRVLGSPSRSDIAQFSPGNAIYSIQAPILLIHSTEDSWIPFPQSDYFAKLLNEAGKSCWLMELRGADHPLSNAAWRSEFLQLLGLFLAEHLHP